MDGDIARSQYENYRYCYEGGHEEWVAKASECFNYWNGKQWDKLIKARLDAEGRPALTFNIIESLIRAMEGMQCALRNDVRFTPVENANVDDARVQDAIWLHAQNENQLDFLESDVYKKGLIMDRAYYECRVSYDKSIKGDIVITSPRSQDVLLDPSVDTYDPKTWPQIIKRRFVSTNDIKNLWGAEKAQAIGLNGMPSWYDYEDEFMSQQMGNMPYYKHDGMGDVTAVRGHLLLDRQYRIVKMKEMFVDLATGDFSEIPEGWERNRVARVLELTPGLGTMKRKVDTLRWRVTCEDVVLHDEDSPYNNYTIVPFFPNFVDGVSMGAVGSLLDPQQLFNKITSQELHIINTTANSGLIVKRNSVKNMTVEEMEQFGSKSGVVFEVDDVEDVKKITPNATPQGHDRLSFKADQIMRSISGVSDQGRGFAREDVAGKAIIANQAGQDLNSAGWLSNLHRTKQLLASVVQDCARGHFTEERVIQINRGSAFMPNMEELTLNQKTPEGTMLNDVTKGRFSTVLVPAPSRATMSEGDFKMLLELRTKVGIAIPDSLLIELSPASNKAQIIEALGQGPDSTDRQRQAEEAAAQQAAIEQQKQVATAQKEESAAMLNQARAEKAAVEASIDPDAAYERVEGKRIEADVQQFQRKAEQQDKIIAETRRKNDMDASLALTKMEHDRETAKQVAREKPAAATPTAKKPGKPKSKSK